MELSGHQQATETLIGQASDTRVEACDRVLDVGRAAAKYDNCEARTLRRLIVEACDKVTSTIMSKGLCEQAVPALLEDIIERQIKDAVVTARPLERPEDTCLWLKE